jgi:hypothetical protein
VHEAEHVLGFVEAGQILDETACFAQELQAHEASLRVWQEVHGESGKPDARTGWEWHLNALVKASRDSTLEPIIRGSPSYRAQCGQSAIPTWAAAVQPGIDLAGTFWRPTGSEPRHGAQV